MKHALIAATAAIVLTLSTHAASKQQVTCAEDQATQAAFCFDPTEITEKNGIRSAPLYRGGPNAVRKTPYYIAANCSTGVLHLKDRDGVSFGGAGPGGGTRQSRALRQYFCEAPVGKAR